MSDETKYVVAAGIIQFDPQTREVNNQTVTDVTIKTPGGEGTLVRVTLWPEFGSLKPEKGDWLAVDGKYSLNSFKDKNGNPRTQAQVSPTSVVLVPGVRKAEREVVGTTNAPIF